MFLPQCQPPTHINYAGAMADLSRHLPLSQRSAHDERHVTSDRTSQLADVVEEAARLIDTEDPSLRAQRAAGFLRQARLDRRRDGLATTDLRAIARRVRGGRKRSVRALAFAVRALLHTAASGDAEPKLDAGIWGAAALWGATSAPLARRAVVRGHTIQATDAEWSFGRGPVLQGRAIDIAAFLLGASERPPIRPARPIAPAEGSEA